MGIIDYLILGFAEIQIAPNDFVKMITLFLKLGIKMKRKNIATVIIMCDKIAEAKSALDEAKINYKIVRVFRAVGSQTDKKKIIATMSALIFTIIIVLFFSSLVWNIEVEGNSNISDSRIISELEKCGLYIGCMWNDVDFGEVENRFLSESNDISWININRNGTVAYVSVIESNSADDGNREDQIRYSNLVASEDCVIEYISVTSGISVVKVGDAVTKGDVLVMGMNNRGELCPADGVVVGRVNKRFLAIANREKTEKIVSSASIFTVKIKIFNFSVNIFKKYRNLGLDCAIIEEKNKIAVLNGKKLPLEILKEYEIQYVTNCYEAGDDELVREARYKMENTLQTLLKNVHLNSIKTYGDFTNEGYEMVSDVIYTCDVSESIELLVD